MGWQFDLTNGRDNKLIPVPSSSSASSSSSTSSQPLDLKPFGFADDLSTNDSGMVNVSVDAQNAAKTKQAMMIAYGPGKSILTTAFMLYMSGTSIQIFSIMSTGMALLNPLKAIASTDATFKKFEGVDVKLAKLLFIALHLAQVGVALYNCSRMGLLPVTSADWLSYLPDRSFAEVAGNVEM